VIVTDILQPTHLLLILAVALLVLGPKRLPSAAKSLGRSVREVKDVVSLDAVSTDPAPAAPGPSAETATPR
jgi:sec-independent protein translocase protein TatA